VQHTEDERGRERRRERERRQGKREGTYRVLISTLQ